MWKGILIFFLNTLFGLCSAQVTVIPGHAHNDYEHGNPLSEALANGFISVEADVCLYNDTLYINHDCPSGAIKGRTLEELYLLPLLKHVNLNNGCVYPGYEGGFFLMIDIKSEAMETYLRLMDLLGFYRQFLSYYIADSLIEGPVRVFISGNRPVDVILSDSFNLAAIDGRPEELGKNIPVRLMPVVSDNYYKYFTWNGEGEMDAVELQILNSLVENTQREGKLLRIWGMPDNENAWRLFLDSGVDLINTDRLNEFREFYVNHY